MSAIDNIFNKLIKTPLIGENERVEIIKNYYNLTDDWSKFAICKQIEYNYCTLDFLESI